MCDVVAVVGKHKVSVVQLSKKFPIHRFWQLQISEKVCFLLKRQLLIYFYLKWIKLTYLKQKSWFVVATELLHELHDMNYSSIKGPVYRI